MTPSLLSKISVLSEAPGIYCGYLWRNVSVVVWSNTATLDSMSLYEEAAKRCRGLNPQGVSAVHVMLPGLKRVPTGETREAIYRINNDCVDFVRAVAVVMLGTGFFVSAMRGLLIALNRHGEAHRGPVAMRIHGTVEAVAEWLPAEHKKNTGVTITAADLTAALHAATGRHLS